jgi:hypothetical protein
VLRALGSLLDFATQCVAADQHTRPPPAPTVCTLPCFRYVAVLRERPSQTWEVLDVQVHGVFYAVLQGSLYVLCYQGELLSPPEAAAERERIAAQLQSLIACPLNPLKFCEARLDKRTLSRRLPPREHRACCRRRVLLSASRASQANVVTEFERLQLCDCTSVIAANAATAVTSRSATGAANELDNYFPFDPMPLRCAKETIGPFYKTWQPAAREKVLTSPLIGTLRASLPQRPAQYL